MESGLYFSLAIGSQQSILVFSLNNINISIANKIRPSTRLRIVVITVVIYTTYPPLRIILAISVVSFFLFARPQSARFQNNLPFVCFFCTCRPLKLSLCFFVYSQATTNNFKMCCSVFIVLLNSWFGRLLTFPPSAKPHHVHRLGRKRIVFKVLRRLSHAIRVRLFVRRGGRSVFILR